MTLRLKQTRTIDGASKLLRAGGGYDIIDPRDGEWIDGRATLQGARDEVAFLESSEVHSYKQAGVKLVIRKA